MKAYCSLAGVPVIINSALSPMKRCVYPRRPLSLADAANITTKQVQFTFRPIRALSRIVQVAAGAQHSLALDALGRVHIWGSGKYGKLGLGDELFRATPVVLSALNELDGAIAMVSAGQDHSACVSERGKVFCWG
jgi:alpha-tubulin suppressor-like RCC1 family protein